MIIEQYGLTLKRINEGDIEQLRLWRNANHVRLKMPNQKLISKVQQKEWFRKVDSEQHLFFLLSDENQSIGCLNIRDIDLENKTGIPGVFIGNSNYLGSIVPVMAVICLLNLGFSALNLKELSSPVLSSNKDAIKLYKELGFEIFHRQEDPRVFDTICFKENFLAAKNKFEEVFGNLTGLQNFSMKIIMKKSNPYYELIGSQMEENTGIQLSQS